MITMATEVIMKLDLHVTFRSLMQICLAEKSVLGNFHCPGIYVLDGGMLEEVLMRNFNG